MDGVLDGVLGGVRDSVLAVMRPWLWGIVLFAAAGGAAVPARAQQPALPQARIVVTGEGSITLPPDYAQISCGVTTRGKTAKEVTDANSKVMGAMTAALLGSGVVQTDIQTSRFSVQPIYLQSSNAESKLSGFAVANQVVVTIRQLAKVGDILDRLVNAGATDIGNIEFRHADASKMLDQARAAAVADARRKAEVYAQASNLALGRTVWITEDAARARAMLMGGMRASVAAAQVPIAAGEDALNVSITVGYDISP